MTALADRNVDVQPVPAGDTAGRVQDDRMADRGPFGVEGLLHDQRTDVTALDDARAAVDRL